MTLVEYGDVFSYGRTERKPREPGTRSNRQSGGTGMKQLEVAYDITARSTNHPTWVFFGRPE